MSPWLLLLTAACYLATLFAIAWWGDRRAERGQSLIANPWVYALSMAVYCTAWTFYGSVGSAATGGLSFLTIGLGPTLGAVLSLVVLRKILRISKLERVTSIADLVASRYGKSRALGALVTVIAVLGLVPYIALQLKAITTSFLLASSANPARASAETVGQTSFGVALVLAAFAILFGTRSLDLTERHEGLVLAVAFESVIKLVAFLAVGLYVTYGLFGGPGELFAQAAATAELAPLLIFDGAWDAWSSTLLISMLAFFFLPRQFQVSVVENVEESHLQRAAWLFPLYLFAINLFVLPVALAGRLRLGPAVDADTFVLSLPLAEGQGLLALLVFIGGLSAATSMVIVECVALSTMVSNDLVLPLLLRKALDRRDPGVGVLLRRVRRLAIVAILAFGQLYLLATAAEVPLASVGLISFAAVAQLAPAILGGLYWRGGTRRGALASLIAGMAVWGYTLPLPSLVGTGLLPASFLESGPWGIAWLRPHALLGLEGLSPIAHSIFWSLLANVSCYLAFSSSGGRSALEVAQARRFVDVMKRTPEAGSTLDLSIWRESTPLTTLRSLLERFLGRRRTERALRDYFTSRRLDLASTTHADAELIAHAEKLLAATTGAASAHIAMASVVQEQELSVAEVLQLLDESSRVLATSRELKEKSRQLEATSQRLWSANQRLRELDGLKDDFLATMAHELRTPLTSIRSFTEILHDHPDLSRSERDRFLGIVLKENERLTRLINQVLDLAKIEAGEPAESRVAVRLGDLAEEAMESLGQLATERGVRLEFRSPADPELRLHRDRMMQVLLNLLGNALHWARGRVTLSIEIAEDELRLAVDDDGPGIPESDRERIFEKFHQPPVRPEGTTRPRGTGLGLPICRGVIENHGGRIRATASPLGGARLLLSLPLRGPSSSSNPAAGSPEARSPHSHPQPGETDAAR
ncbi:MAG: sensor histidine kinase [Acidobacteriota bacterium]